MTKIRVVPLLATLLCLSLPAAAIWAAGETIERNVMGGGGEQVAAGGYILVGTIAEPVAGNMDTAAGADYHLGSGFWGGGISAGNDVYLPVVLR